MQGGVDEVRPGGSVKDRAAAAIVDAAEKSGKLRPGGTVVEGTAGNTGIGLARVCLARGYRCVIFIPETQCAEKFNLLRSLGVDLNVVPAVSYTNPLNFNHQARDYAEQRENVVWGDQFDNTANRQGHYMTTGPEIWEALNGRLDAFTCATGTGGTLAGTGTFLKEASGGRVQIWAADPPGSIVYDFVKSGIIPATRTGSSITEGIGQGRITKNLEGVEIDDALRIPDEESVAMVFRLMKEEGIFVGASSALNVVAAAEVARRLGPGSTVVSVLCDGVSSGQLNAAVTRLNAQRRLD